MPGFGSKASTVYPAVMIALGFRLAAPDGLALVPAGSRALDFIDVDRPKMKRGPSKPLWRKREIVRQERTVQYTTVDSNGALQVCVCACVCIYECAWSVLFSAHGGYLGVFMSVCGSSSVLFHACCNIEFASIISLPDS